MADSAPRWITDTGRAVRRASDAAHAQEELKTLGTAIRELGQVRGDIADLVEAYRLDRGPWRPDVAVPASLRASMATTEGELAHRELNAAVKELKQFTTRTRGSIHTAWRNHVDAETSGAAEIDELVELLVGDSRLGSVARNLKQALDSLPELRSELPNRSSVEQLVTTVALSEAFRSALPEAVEGFVLAAASGGASLTLLNSEVIAWLSDNGATDNFKVIAGKPQGVARGR